MVLVHNKKSETKIIWDEYYRIYDVAFQKQEQLQIKKDQILSIEDNNEKEEALNKVLKEMRDHQNEVNIKQSKLRIKARVISPDASSGMSDRLSN